MVAIAALSLSVTIPSTVPTLLRYLQLFLLFIAADNAEKPLMCGRFAIAYTTLFALTGWLTASAAARPNPILEMAGELAGAAVLLALFFCYRRQGKYIQENASRKQWQRFVGQIARLRQKHEQTILDQDVLFQHLLSCQNLSRHIQRKTNGQGMQEWQSLDQYCELVRTLQATLVPQVFLAKQLQNLTQEVTWQPMIHNMFQHACTLRNSVAASTATSAPPDTHIELHSMEDVPPRWRLPGRLFWQWIMWSWLDYLLVCSDRRCLSIWVSQRASDCYLLKGVANLAAVAVAPELAASKCLRCGRYVRQLHRLEAWDVTGCRDCLKNEVERRLQEDWENPPRSEIWPGRSLWLSRRLLTHFALGNVYYGIQNIENWEYFVTLSVRW
jgi:hypothetical protein